MMRRHVSEPPRLRSTPGTISRRRRLTVAAVTAAAVLTVDQLTKAWAQASLPPGRFVAVIAHWFGFGLVSNRGAAFGLLGDQRTLVTVLAGGLLLVIGGLLVRGTLSSPLTAVALGAILGGGLSNLVDRIRLKAAVDFIVLRPWPSDFNLADVAIRLGAVLLVASVILREMRQPHHK